MDQETQVMDKAIKAMTIKTGKYLTFTLEKEEYGRWNKPGFHRSF